MKRNEANNVVTRKKLRKGSINVEGDDDDQENDNHKNENEVNEDEDEDKESDCGRENSSKNN